MAAAISFKLMTSALAATNVHLRLLLQAVSLPTYLSELNSELLDTLLTSLEWVREYSEKYGIPLRDQESLEALITFARRVMKNLRREEKQLMSRKLRAYEDDDPDPDELPEPGKAKFNRCESSAEKSLEGS
ncbi:MAG: hypothetical protein ACE5KH_02155 [Candidatus Geothermarchaeales archaeon]